ncbi:MAG: 50S ribosomal protein L35 [Candidatus Hodgkinia cicadicola]
MIKFKPKSAIAKRFIRLASGRLKAFHSRCQRKLSKPRRTTKQHRRSFIIVSCDSAKLKSCLK